MDTPIHTKYTVYIIKYKFKNQVKQLNLKKTQETIIIK